MPAFTEPSYTRSRVVAAGKRVRDHRLTAEDSVVIDNWRASHAYVLNIFQTTLRQRSRGKEIVVAQRLKRRHTIFDKLRREPHMQLAYMHDIAGCRLIFQDVDQLTTFREGLHSSRAKHELRSDDPEQYNYIKKPKPSGYRGVHDVYRFKVASAAGAKWNGHLIEIQFRTIYQHAWATAVEVADLITTNRIKFGEAEGSNIRFFQLASEIISRYCEGLTSCEPEMENEELVRAFRDSAEQTRLLDTFSRLRISEIEPLLRQNVILIYNFAEVKGAEPLLEVETFDTQNAAIVRYQQLERERENKADIVLVRAQEDAYIRNAYRNYFSDVNDFLSYIEDGVGFLQMKSGEEFEAEVLA